MTEALQAISGTQQVMSSVGSRGPELQQLSDRFNSMMKHEPDPSIYTEQHLIEGTGSPVTAFVRSQESVLRQTFDDVRAFSTEAPTLNAHELAVRHIELSYQMAMVQVQFNAGVYVAQSGKTGLQTLMKNQ